MTAKCALAHAFLNGKTLSIMNGFREFSITNLPREASRLIEHPFGVELTRTRIDFTSRYGQTGFYFTYKLENKPQNADGILRMKEYVYNEYKSQPLPQMKPKNTTATKFNKYIQPELL